ncbi:hypothetical protein B0J11DRAFT_517878 [Dendryphion nanum]|uniref:Uncharacterized protein n=1 Tax=Dendryphion nanum TaxID=256645 RepID=A0A9P9EDQ9_9PLEO|nr:hypothetical protein B0J11DRAFT_517878 [Dendryphion nanum]
MALFSQPEPVFKVIGKLAAYEVIGHVGAVWVVLYTTDSDDTPKVVLYLILTIVVFSVLLPLEVIGASKYDPLMVIVVILAGVEAFA